MITSVKKRQQKSKHRRRLQLFGYLRRSTDVQDDLSFERQRELIERWAANNDAEIIDYLTEQISGNSPRRPVFDSICERLRDGEGDGLIAAEHDRISRARPLDIVNLIDELQRDHDKKVIAADKGELSTLDFTSLLQLFLNAHHAHEFLIAQAVRMHHATARWAQEGRVCGGGVTYGYRRNNGDKHDPLRGKLVIHKEEARVVRRIFKLALEGHRPRGIARILTEAGIPAPRAGVKAKKGRRNGVTFRSAWNAGTIAGYLKNRRYVGDLTWGYGQSYRLGKNGRRESYINVDDRRDAFTIADTHEGIISAADFDRVQALMETWKRGPRKSAQTTALVGLLRCPCGEPLLSTRNENDGPRWYRCQSYKTKKCEYGTKIREDDILPRLATTLAEFFNSDELRQRYLDAKRRQLGAVDSESQVADLQAQLREARGELDKVEEDEMRAIELGKDHLLDRYQAKRDGINGKIARLSRQLKSAGKIGESRALVESFIASSARRVLTLEQAFVSADDSRINAALSSHIAACTIWTKIGHLTTRTGRKCAAGQVFDRCQIQLLESGSNDNNQCQLLPMELGLLIAVDAAGKISIRLPKAA